ncbi:MAG: hypothetical protein ACPL28_00575 [bacterium]
MIILYLVGIYLGIEAGMNQPMIGLDYDLQSGVIFKAIAGKQNISIAFSGSYYHGKNLGYSFSNYGLSILIKKSNWRVSPFVESGLDYIARQLDSNKEWGIGFNYAIGFLIGFHYDNIEIYPSFYYDGLTDFKVNAGNLGIKLGIGYEL